MTGLFPFLTFIAIVGFLGSFGSSPTPPTKTPQPTTQNVKGVSVSEAPSATPIPTKIIYPTVTRIQSSNLGNSNYYTNTDGNEVHSPTNTIDNSIPAGATARCGDGTYSFSQNHRGTCSYHQGVAQWL